ncbi:MAG: hypothetical protein ACT6S0_07090 [Roseateles sp.]|uniref:hypothetical protein n=1 Tax=Roseateles sp. TaxID=1971397 RepID=UPI0040354620
MARSSLLGIDPAAAEPAGRDKASLGPGDSSDSGSDVVGLDSDEDDADPGLPVDVALRDDQIAPLPLGESLASREDGAGVRDGADIGVDRIFTPDQPEGDLDRDTPALRLLEEAETDPEDEEGDEEGVNADDAPTTRSGRRARPVDEPPSEEALPGVSDPAERRPGRGD